MRNFVGTSYCYVTYKLVATLFTLPLAFRKYKFGANTSKWVQHENKTFRKGGKIIAHLSSLQWTSPNKVVRM